MEEELKKVNITGINNRYQINKIINKKGKEIKKRVESLNWSFSNENYEYSNQFQKIIDISNNNLIYNDDVSKIIIQQIKKNFVDINNKIF